MNLSTADLLEWVNAFELVITVAFVILLVRYIANKIESWADFLRRSLRIWDRNFQGGPYDLAIALCVLLAGKALRAETIWEWRHFGGELDMPRLALAVLVISAGALCAVRVLSPTQYFNRYALVVFVLAASFATGSILL